MTNGWDRLTRVTAPAALALSRADAKAHLKIDSDFEDAVVDSLIDMAIAECEGPKGRGLALVTQTWALSLDRFTRYIRIPMGPNVEVVTIAYVDPDGVTQTLDDPLTDWLLVAGQDPALLVPPFGACWPAVRCQPGAVTITFTAGFGATAADVPADLVGALKLIVGGLYKDRDGGELPRRALDVLDRYAPLAIA